MMCHQKQRYLIYLRDNKTDMKQISVLALLFFSIFIYPPIFAYGCDFAGPVDNFVSVFDMNGEKIVDRKLERFSVGADCSIQNKVLVGEGDTVYIENEFDILTHVDFSSGKWQELNDYPMGDYDLTNYNKFLNIYDGKIVVSEYGNYVDLQSANTTLTEYTLMLQDLQNQDQKILTMNIFTELSKLGSNYTIAYDYILPTSRANWVSLISVVNVENADTNNSLLWLYRYDMNTEESISFSLLDDKFIDYFQYDPVFHISESGNKGYFINGYPYETIYIFDYEDQSIERATLDNAYLKSGIQDDNIFGVISEQGEDGNRYFLKVLDLETMKYSSVFEFKDSYVNKFYLLDNFILVLDTRSGADAILGIDLFPSLGLSLAVLVVSKRKIFAS